MALIKTKTESGNYLYIRVFKSIKIVMSTNLEYRTREKEKVGKKGDRDLDREIKNKEDIFLLEEQQENFVAAVTKWEMLAATNARWKWAALKKKVNENTYNIFSIKRVTKKCL